MSGLAKKTRLALDLNQADFARIFDVHAQTVSKWERGVLVPSPVKVAHMHKIFICAKQGGYRVQIRDVLTMWGAAVAFAFLLHFAYAEI